MQVAVARRDFHPLVNTETAWRAREAPYTKYLQASKMAAQPVTFFTHPSTRYGITTAPKHAVGEPAHYALERPATTRTTGATLASHSMSSKIHRTAKPTEWCKGGLCRLGSACNEV